jgi:cytoskeletal protein RodZ
MFRKKPKIDPIVQQREKLKELGSRLQQIRAEKGLSLDVVSRKTMIPRRLLESIEIGQMDNLPEPIYIRWLIKQFAETLGLDGAAFSSEFPVQIKPQTTQSRFLRLPNFQLRPFHLYFLYILLLLFSVRTISNVLEQSTLEINRLPSPVVPSLQPSPIPQPNSTPVQTVTATNPPSKTELDKSVIVDIQLKDDSWLKVISDGKKEFEGLLPGGTHRTWKADKELTVRAGNAGSVFITVNKEQAKQLGQPGQVEEVTYTAN